MHIVSRDPELLARFVAQGFQPGLAPPRTPVGGLHDLTAVMLRAFGDLPTAQLGAATTHGRVTAQATSSAAGTTGAALSR